MRYAKKFTRARSLFKAMKRFGYLTCLKVAMSFSRRRGYSRATTKYWVCPFWNSLMVEFHGMAASFKSS